MRPDTESTEQVQPVVRKMKRDKERDGKRDPRVKRRDISRKRARAAKRGQYR
jgi:hypothetical protein